MAALLRGGDPLQIPGFCSCVSTKDIPADLRVVSSGWDVFSRMTVLLVESGTFSPVPENEIIPFLKPRYRKESFRVSKT